MTKQKPTPYQLKTPLYGPDGNLAPWLESISNRPDIALAKVKARRHLLNFTMYTMPDYEINWHHRIMCDYLEQWAFGDIKRLMIFMPPGSGKSELVSIRLPAWILGRNPNAFIMATSYSASLIRGMNKAVQRILQSEEYHELFPETQLYTKSARKDQDVEGTYTKNTEEFEIVNNKGYYKCAGVGGSITGKRFQFGIIDDPLKGRSFAESQTIRDHLWNWYTDDFYSRQFNKDARILITLTRWHQADLAGLLLQQMAENPVADQWTVLKFPMEAEDELEPGDPRRPGDPLWPSRFGKAEIEVLKTQGTYTWNSLYQQHPSVAGGLIFNRGWWGSTGEDRDQFYKLPPAEQAQTLEQIIQSWDCTFKDTSGTDFVVGQVWGKKGADRYLLDQTRARMDVIVTMQAIRTMSAKWPKAVAKLVEDKANGTAVIAMLKHEIPGLIAVEPQGGKVVRAQATAPYVEAGNIWLPLPKYASWIHDFIEEMSAFPQAAHDDQVDSCTQALQYWQKPAGMPVPTHIPRKIIRSGNGYSGPYI